MDGMPKCMKINLLFLAFLTVLASCHKDHDDVKDEEIFDPPVIQITTRLVSQTDTTFDAARHATQVFAGTSTSFSAFPFVVSRGNNIDRDFELITLETEEHYQFYQSQTLVENDVNYLHWVLPPLQIANGQSGSDATITIDNSYVLTIPAGSLQYTDGSAYSGSYSIAYSLLDPTTHLNDAIPSYQAIDERKQLKALEFQSCFYIAVKSETGTTLQFTSAAHLDLPGSITGTQWYFETGKSAWKANASSDNETTFTLNASNYYALADARPATRMTGVLRINNRLAPHHAIKITGNTISRNVYSTNNGAFAIYLPSGQEITIDVVLPCGNTFTTTLTVPDENEFALPITIDDQGCTNGIFTGTLRNNQGNEVSEGFLLFDNAMPGYLYSGKAVFIFPIPICNANILGVQGLDIATGETGPVIQWAPADSVHLFSVFACEQSKMEYLSLTVSGDTKMYWDLVSSINLDSRLVIEEGATETELDLEIDVSGTTNREYSDTELNIRFLDEQLGQRGYSLYCPTSTTGCGFSKFIITHFPEGQGEWIRGYFEGEFWIKTFHPLTAAYRPVRGEFQVYRDF